jgi:hypothetical protein
MEKNKTLELQLEETMNSLDGIRKAGPGPFFYTRVMARLESEEKNLWEMITAFIAKPVVIASVISFILLLNATAVFREADSLSDLADQSDVSLVDEYQIASTSFYDYTNAEP